MLKIRKLQRVIAKKIYIYLLNIHDQCKTENVKSGIDHQNFIRLDLLGFPTVTWDLKVKTLDLFVTCTCETYSHFWELP